MSYRSLVWIPIAVAAACLGIELFLGPASQSVAVGWEVEIAKVLWLAGAVAAARGFEPGDYLRRGWSLLGAGVLLYFLRDVSRTTLVATGVPAMALGVLRAVLVVAGNACQVGGVFVLARVWRAVGLDDAVRGQRRSLFAIAVAIAVAILGPSIAHDAASAASGNLDAVPHLASDLGDAVTFVLLAALVRTALALRGGVVFWTWSLFAAGELAWMFFDGARTLSEHFGAGAQSPPLVESLRVAGALYFFAAGLAQRWISSARFPVEAAGPVGILEDPRKMV